MVGLESLTLPLIGLLAGFLKGAAFAESVALTGAFLGTGLEGLARTVHCHGF